MRHTTDRVRHYHGIYDPVATFARLRAAGVLGSYSYLHMTLDGAEIGWEPLDRAALLPSDTGGWMGMVTAVAAQAASLQRKAFGYVGFDAIDGKGGELPDRTVGGLPLAEFIIPGEVLSFSSEHVSHRSRSSLDVARYLTARLAPRSRHDITTLPPLTPSFAVSDDSFMSMVARATDTLRNGHLHKIVLSRYETFDIEYDPLALFAGLCLSRPYVDAFLVCFGELTAVVASPELLLSARNRNIVTNPLAGTRPRGATIEEDEALRAELKLNHKEIVEHVLSVTTILSELEPMCEPETLVVSRLMDVSLQQKVQHLSSTMRGTLLNDFQALDALSAIFPSITVSGLPKAEAIAEIRSLEKVPRWLYSGTIGWVTGAGDARFSLAIRSAFRYRQRTFLHAGAGIMSESSPAHELQETRDKLSASKEALSWALATDGSERAK